VHRAVYFVVGPALILALALTSRADKSPGTTAASGETLYLQQCAPCHGAKGEGAKGYPHPLMGTRTVGELARFIAQSMPPGSRHCPALEAQKIAAYLYDAFYSPIAQERNRPSRVALARLTVRQFRNAVADLVGAVRQVVP